MKSYLTFLLLMLSTLSLQAVVAPVPIDPKKIPSTPRVQSFPSSKKTTGLRRFIQKRIIQWSQKKVAQQRRPKGTNKSPKKKLDLLALIAFILTVLTVVFVTIGGISMFWPLMYWGGSFFFAGLILGILSLDNFKNKPDVRGKWMALSPIMLAFAMITFLIGLVIYANNYLG